MPQFYNVLVGEMSLLTAPERQHFIDLISARAPHYHHLQKVRPGITSQGQVKYGYAENVDQMVQRLRFDLIYIENMSLGSTSRSHHGLIVPADAEMSGLGRFTGS